MPKYRKTEEGTTSFIEWDEEPLPVTASGEEILVQTNEDNPALKIWREAHAGASLRWLDRMDYSSSVDRNYTSLTDSLRARDEVIRKYSFAVPNEEALALIGQFSPIVEIGAGTGYWAGLLRNRGVEVEAYDIMGDKWKFWFPEGAISPIKKGNQGKVLEHPDHTLLLVWPYMDDMAVSTLRLYKGEYLIYVGEGESGACANDAFFYALEDDWEEIAQIDIPQWYGIHDALWLYRRI